MTKRVNPQFILQAIKDGCDEVIFTSSEQITRAGAQTVALGTLALVSGDFTIATGDAAGDSEKISLVSKAITWASSGTVTHACFFKTTGDEFILCTPALVNKAVNATDDGTIGALKMWEIGGAL